MKDSTMDREITETGTDHPSKSDPNPGWDGSEAEGEASRSLGEGRAGAEKAPNSSVCANITTIL